MECLENNDVYYEGEIINMLGSKKRKNIYAEESARNEEPNEKVKIDDLLIIIENLDKKIDKLSSDSLENRETSIPTKNDNEKNNRFLNFFNSHPFGMSVVASIIATLILSLISIIINKYILFPSIVNSRLDFIETKLEDFDYNDLTKRIDRLEINVATIANVTDINLYSDLEYTDDFISKLFVKSETVENKYYSSEPPCQNNDIIAISIKTGDEYTKEQLAGEKLLIPYTYNGQEVLFYGQYNENNNWDQDCLINVYENDKLVLISETVYDNGIPTSSKQVFPSKTKDGANVWSITDRKYEKDFNNGKTWNYFRLKEFSKTFEFNNAEIDDILNVSDFKDDIKSFSLLEGYYYGKVQNGKYNDDEKNVSYMVKNDNNGFVRTVYIGNFKDGDFDDTTGKAEEIVYDGTVNKYFYYIGKFENGERENDDNLKYIDWEDIDRIIKSCDFDDCDLNWHDTKDAN